MVMRNINVMSKVIVAIVLFIGLGVPTYLFLVKAGSKPAAIGTNQKLDEIKNLVANVLANQQVIFNEIKKNNSKAKSK